VQEELTLRVRKADSKGDSLWLSLRHILSSVPDPRPIRANIWAELHLWDDVVVGADLEGLVTAHDQAGLAVLLVLQQSNVTGTTLSPLVGLLDELEKLGAHLEGLVLDLLAGLDLDLLSQANDWLEVNIFGLWGLILYRFVSTMFADESSI
jgi:hypothetical protein